MAKRTLEQLIKFDSGLPVGRSAVNVIRKDGSPYPACVEIGSRGAVRLIRRPTSSGMYTSWHSVKGDDCTPTGSPIVWGARNTAILEMFENPVATIDLRALADQ